MPEVASELADVDRRLDDAICHLREQQALMVNVDCPTVHGSFLMLLSNGLRLFRWLEDQRKSLCRGPRTSWQEVPEVVEEAN